MQHTKNMSDKRTVFIVPGHPEPVSYSNFDKITNKIQTSSASYAHNGHHSMPSTPLTGAISLTFVQFYFFCAQDCWFEVYTTIGRYGTIVDCREHGARVLFALENTDKTHELKSMRTLHCAGMSIPIEQLAYMLAYPDFLPRISDIVLTPRPPPSDVAPPNILQYLNDDCLWDIFRMRALDQDDLCAAASACVRFNGAARQAFVSRYRRELKLHFKWPFRRYVALLRLFGDCITSIDVGFVGSTHAYGDVVLGLIAFHCRHIERLECALLRPMTSAIARFERRKCSGVEEAMPFGQLRSLKLVGYCGNSLEAMPVLRLPHLVDLHISYLSMSGAGEAEQFFRSHRQIKRLALSSVEPSFRADKILLLLADLEELHIRGSPGIGDLRCVGQLKRLKVLTCCKLSDRDVRLALHAISDGHVQLQRLTIIGEKLPAIAASIGSLEYVACELRGKGVVPPVLDTSTLAAVAAAPNLKEIHLRLRAPVSFAFIREFLASAPAKVTVARFHVDCFGRNGGGSFDRNIFDAIDGMIENGTFAVIAGMVKLRAIRLHVTLHVTYVNRKVAEEKLHRFGDWLTAVAAPIPSSV